MAACGFVVPSVAYAALSVFTPENPSRISMRFTGGIQNRAIIPITRRSDKVTGRKVGGWIQRRLRVSPVAFLAQESMEQAELEAPSQDWPAAMAKSS